MVLLLNQLTSCCNIPADWSAEDYNCLYWASSCWAFKDYQQKHTGNGLQMHDSHSLPQWDVATQWGMQLDSVLGHKRASVLNCIALIRDYSRRKNANIKLYLQNSYPNGLKFSSVIWLNREKKKREKKEGRGEEGAERCTPNYWTICRILDGSQLHWQLG